MGAPPLGIPVTTSGFISDSISDSIPESFAARQGEIDEGANDLERE